MENNENQIIRQLKAGDEGSYSQLFNEYYIVLSVFSARYVKDMETAKEIVQDFFVHLFEIRNSLIIKTSLKSFLYQAVRNRSLNHLKHLKLHEHHLENLKAESDYSSSLEENMKAAELEYKIFQQVGKLPTECQRIFKMSRIEGKKNLEISEILNISKRTVETQISKALKLLRDNLKEYLKS